MSFVVAIDGPSGSGKSTVARGVAARLGLHVLDTGAMYRAVTLAALDGGVDLTDAETCGAVARESRIELEDEKVRLNGRDVSGPIRGPEVTAAVSTVSAHPPVRAELVTRQRAWVAERDGGVIEGRDIGTVVFPEASLKVFLPASDDERARRRQRDEVAAARAVAVDEVRDALARRDTLDSTREVSPLRAAPDAVVLDTTGRGPETVVAEIIERLHAGRGEGR